MLPVYDVMIIFKVVNDLLMMSYVDDDGFVMIIFFSR